MKVIGGKNGGASYVLGEQLGAGSFGKVYSSAPWAIKQMKMEKDSRMRTAFHNQISIMQKLTHPNVVQLHEVINEGNSIYIVMECCKGDLRKYLAGKRVEEKTAVCILKQVLSGLSKLVEKNVIHRDLKPANILVGSKGEFKVADFGAARVVEQYDRGLLDTIAGTPLYMAPQILQRTTYTTKCDIWSVGIIFYEMLVGRPPWTASNERELLHNITTKPLTLSSKVSAWSNDLLTRMLHIEQHTRIGWEDLFKYVTQTPIVPNLTPTSQPCQIDALIKLFQIDLEQIIHPSLACTIVTNPKRSISQSQLQAVELVLQAYVEQCQTLIRNHLSI